MHHDIKYKIVAHMRAHQTSHQQNRHGQRSEDEHRAWYNIIAYHGATYIIRTYQKGVAISIRMGTHRINISTLRIDASGTSGREQSCCASCARGCACDVCAGLRRHLFALCTHARPHLKVYAWGCAGLCASSLHCLTHAVRASSA